MRRRPTPFRRLRRAGQVVVFYLLLLWLGAMLLCGSLASLPLLAAPRGLREPLVQALISHIFRLFLDGSVAAGLMRCDLAALDALNAASAQVLVANHPSMIDVFLIVSRVRHAVCLMKFELRFNPFLTLGAYLAGYVASRRADQLLKNAAAAVAQGRLLLVFPEGTRTIRQPINPIKPGAALIARMARAPVQTIVLRTNSPYLGKGWPIWRPPAFPLVYQARLGERLAPAPTTQAGVAAIEAAFRREIERSIDPALHH